MDGVVSTQGSLTVATPQNLTTGVVPARGVEQLEEASRSSRKSRLPYLSSFGSHWAFFGPSATYNKHQATHKLRGTQASTIAQIYRSTGGLVTADLPVECRQKR